MRATSGRAKAGRRAARNQSSFAVTVRQLVENAEAHRRDDHLSMDCENEPDEMTSLLPGPEHGGGDEPVSLLAEIEFARERVNAGFREIVVELAPSLPRSRWTKPTPRTQMTLKTNALPMRRPIVSPERDRECRDERPSLNDRELLPKVTDFRSIDRWVQHCLNLVSTAPSGQSGSIVPWLLSIIKSVALRAGVSDQSSGALVEAMRNVVCGSDGRTFEEHLLLAQGDNAVLTKRLSRRESQLTSFAIALDNVARRSTERLAAQCFRQWRHLARLEKGHAKVCTSIIVSTKQQATLNQAFVLWRRQTVMSRRKSAEMQCTEAKNDARAAKQSLHAAVMRSREESIRDLKKLQVKYDEEKSLREAQFATLSGEIQTLSEEVSVARHTITHAIQERDLWRRCWGAMKSARESTIPPPIPAIIATDALAIKAIVSRLLAVDSVTRLKMFDTNLEHRSVSTAPDIVSESVVRGLTGELKERVQDLLLHWANSKLALLNVSEPVLSVDDLTTGIALRAIFDSILTSYGAGVSGAADGDEGIHHMLQRLCECCSAFPIVQPLLAFCPYAGRCITKEDPPGADEAAWYYWMLATSLVFDACASITVELHNPSELKLVRDSPPDLNSLLRRPVAEEKETSGAPPREVESKHLRRSKSSVKQREVPRQRKSPKVEIDHRPNQALLLEEISKDTQDDAAAEELEWYTAVLQRSNDWVSLAGLVSVAIVELNCLEYDPSGAVFRYSVPVVADSTAAMLLERGRMDEKVAPTSPFAPFATHAVQAMFRDDAFLHMFNA